MSSEPRIQRIHIELQRVQPWRFAVPRLRAMMANAGEIPAFKTRRQWRIKRADLDKWIDARPCGGDGDRSGE